MNNLIAQTSDMWRKKHDLTYYELSNLGNTKEMLGDIIDYLIIDLEKYKLISNPSSFYIEKQTKYINNLIKVNDVQSFYLYHDYLVQANEAIMDIMKRDNNIGIIRTDFVFNENKHLAYHKINIWK